MPELDINGTRLDFVEQGSGDPVVFVHGSASDHRTWQAQLPAIGKTFHAIAYSRRYHWPNEQITEGASYSLFEQVDDLADVLRTLDIAPPHLVGHSYGGLVCLVFAARHPDRVRTLVLGEPPVMSMLVTIPPKPREILQLALRRPRTAVGIVKLGGFGLGPAAIAFERGDTDEAMRLMGTAILGRQAFADLSPERRSQVRDNLIKEELLSPEFLPTIDEEEVRRIRIPVLLVGGDRSPRLFAHLLNHLESILVTTERTEIPGASHLMHEDNSAAYNQAVLAFLSMHRSNTSN